MSKSFKVDLTGQRFGRWTVIEFVPRDCVESYWRCKCDCGNEAIVYGSHLKKGRSKSCGCLQIERTKETFIKHSGRGTRLYNIYKHIKSRCLNPNNPHYSYYGGRGISICNEWLNNFIAFRDWALQNGYTDELTIDRVDVNGNYEPTNCRWVDRKIQGRNRRTNTFVEYDGNRVSLAEAAELSGIKYETLVRRHTHGDRGERLFRPVRVCKSS